MKPILAAIMLCFCVSAVLIAVEPESAQQSTVYLHIISNDGSGSLTGAKLVLPMTGVDDTDGSMTFSDGTTVLKITGTETKADWSLRYKNRPYRATIDHEGPLFSLTAGEGGAILKVIKKFNISAISMNMPTAYIVQPGSYIFLAEQLEGAQ